MHINIVALTETWLTVTESDQVTISDIMYVEIKVLCEHMSRPAMYSMFLKPLTPTNSAYGKQIEK